MMRKNMSPFLVFGGLALSIILLGEAAALSWRGQPASAGVAAALSIVVFILTRPHNIELFEAFGVKLRLRDEIEEAKSLLERMERFGSAASLIFIVQLSWMNRLGSPTWMEKRELVSRVDEIVKNTDIDESELKDPLFCFLEYDLFGALRGEIIEKSDDEGVREFGKNHELNKLQEGLIPGRRSTDFEQAMIELTTDLPTGTGSHDELKALAQRLVTMASESRNKGNVTISAASYLDSKRKNK